MFLLLLKHYTFAAKWLMTNHFIRNTYTLARLCSYPMSQSCGSISSKVQKIMWSRASVYVCNKHQNKEIRKQISVTKWCNGGQNKNGQPGLSCQKGYTTMHMIGQIRIRLLVDLSRTWCGFLLLYQIFNVLRMPNAFPFTAAGCSGTVRVTISFLEVQTDLPFFSDLSNPPGISTHWAVHVGFCTILCKV